MTLGSANLQFDASGEDIIEQAERLNTTNLTEFYVVLVGEYDDPELTAPDTACVRWIDGVPTVTNRFKLSASYKAIDGVLVSES